MVAPDAIQEVQPGKMQLAQAVYREGGQVLILRDAKLASRDAGVRDIQ